MRQVIFARDRRRKKNRIKAILFLMALVSIFIGIVLSLKSQNAAPENRKVVLQTAVLSEQDKQKPKTDESIAAHSTEIPLALSHGEQPSGAESHENLQTDGMALNHGEPTFIDIDINEADEDDESRESVDENATSYEDELSDVDDVDDESQKSAQASKNELSLEAQEALDDFLAVADQALRIQNQFSYTVTRGDKLKDVLEQSGLGAGTAKQLEKKVPQLAHLQAGQQFYWTLDKNGELDYMSWLMSEKEETIFERKNGNQFSVRRIEKQGTWKQDVVKGTISSSFNASLKDVGLSQRQINQLAAGLQWQIATNKLKKGDKFAILVKREYINGKVTDLGNVEAIHIMSSGKSYYAIQAENGRYYSRHGETLGKGFARYPLQFTPRVSSPFNPRRLHPVTRRVAPHKGVDFGVPTGTPIIAPADGVIEHIAYQANGAGRYIKLRHSGQYTTVYMHLSRALVKVGQHVKKGERIALSGNTGRSTGAHLHYEFHINGHPVNPMTIKLPGTESSMPSNERKSFLAKAKTIEAKLKF